MKYQCPVCGYKQLTHPPVDDTICPCCGTHFGYHDYATAYEDLRAMWISRGAQWFSKTRQPPEGWDGMTQLFENGLAVLVGQEESESTFIECDFEPLDFSRTMKAAQKLPSAA